MVAPAKGRPSQSRAVTANVPIAAAAASTATRAPEDRTAPRSALNVTVNSRHGFSTVNTKVLSTRSAPGPSTPSAPTSTPASTGRRITTYPSITRSMAPSARRPRPVEEQAWSNRSLGTARRVPRSTYHDRYGTAADDLRRRPGGRGVGLHGVPRLCPARPGERRDGPAGLPGGGAPRLSLGPAARSPRGRAGPPPRDRPARRRRHQSLLRRHHQRRVRGGARGGPPVDPLAHERVARRGARDHRAGAGAGRRHRHRQLPDDGLRPADDRQAEAGGAAQPDHSRGHVRGERSPTGHPPGGGVPVQPRPRTDPLRRRTGDQLVGRRAVA